MVQILKREKRGFSTAKKCDKQIFTLSLQLDDKLLPEVSRLTIGESFLGVKEKAGTYFTVRGSTFELTQRFAETPLIGPLHINPAHSQSEHKILPQADEMSIGVYNSQR